MAAPNPTSSTNPVGYQPATPYKPKVPNPALRMLGISKLKLPSRNWMIFFAITGSLSAAIIYDRREKDRATLKWAKSVAHLAKEPISNPSQLPRKLTIYLESPPGDGLRAAQDHFRAYVKPILAASGLDWDFVQGRKEGDVRAAVAEKIRRTRRAEEGIEQASTEEDMINEQRKRNKTPEYEGTLGDVVIGRHTWKEYVRGLHEGWLGPLEAPLKPGPETPIDEPDKKAEDNENKPDEEEKKPKRPPQPPPYNSPDDYPTSALPVLAPSEFQPAAIVQFPHLLGFLNTPTRVWRYMHRRKVADDIGRQVAAACLCTVRDFRESDGEYELQRELQKEEKDWVKSVWKDDEKKKKDDASLTNSVEEKEKVWTRPVVVDPRIAMRMRRFEVDVEAEERAKEVVVKEEEIEGFIKGSIRKLWRWGVSRFETKDEGPWVES